VRFRSGPVLILALSLALLLLCGAPATDSFAQGAVSLSWDFCTGPFDKAVLPGSVANVWVSVLGQNQLHKGYSIEIALKQEHALTDAWRFDAAGCQGPFLIYLDLFPVIETKACPIFMQSSAPSLQIKDFSYIEALGRARVVLANSYPNGVATVSPQARYLLGRVSFDQTYGVNGPSGPNECGGLEIPLCIDLVSASWQTLDGIDTPWAISQEQVTANDPANSTRCPNTETTPVRSRTWGALKSQYRN
jgi:hypothetical protein